MGLNENQLKAVQTIEGPLLLIAGPGSGKTHTLVERVIYLLEKGIEPYNILISTFTEKASLELITRISNRVKEKNLMLNINEIYIGTIHSICLRIIKENIEYSTLKKNYKIMDQFEQQYFIYKRIKEYNSIKNYEDLFGKTTSNWRQSEKILTWVNKLSEELVDVKMLNDSDNKNIRIIGEIYKIYEKQLIEENCLDFSNIQVEAYKILTQNDNVLMKLQEQIKYIMVDEYQDTNTIQEKIILKIGEISKNICVVGDEDQGIYRFRGATIRNILEFPMKFERGCKIIKLEENYRSHPDIINFYNKWMNNMIWSEGNKSFRYDKTIRAYNGKFVNNPSVIKVSGFDYEENWHKEIYEFILDLKEKNVISDLNQIAFLFKSVKNDKVKSLINYLENKDIPVYSPRSGMFFERGEIKYMIGALLAIFPQYEEIKQWDNEVELDIWDYYHSCLRMFLNYLNEHKNSDLHKWCAKMAMKHLNLKGNTNYTFTGLFYQLLQFKLFKNFLDKDYFGKVIDDRSSYNLGILSQILSKFEYINNIMVITPKNINSSIKDLFNNYLRFVKDGGINEYEDLEEYSPSGCVSFLTIHQSKGLEFPIVFVGSLESSPQKQYTDVDEVLQNDYFSYPVFEPLEKTKYFDFWRLYYTAFSRAQNLLILTCCETKNREKGRRRCPSKSFEELYSKLISWRDHKFSIYKLVLSKVKDADIKKQFSFTSHITLYENCPIQYKFFKELQFSPVRKGATLFGTLVHQTIEDIHKAVLRSEENIITLSKVEEWFNINYNYLVKREKLYLTSEVKDAALYQVLKYVDRQNNDWSRVKEAEVEVSLVKDNYILNGQVDLLRGENNTVEIVDFKSEKKPDLQKDRDRIDIYKKQLEVYAYLIEERTSQKVSNMYLYYTGEESGNPYIKFEKNDSSINETIAEFDTVVNKIRNKHFNIEKKPEKFCENCDMRFYCEIKK